MASNNQVVANKMVMSTGKISDSNTHLNITREDVLLVAQQLADTLRRAVTVATV